MIVRNINSQNDWRFGHGFSDYTRDAYAVALDIKMKLQEWYQDCFFALQNGIDWKTRLGAHNQKILLDDDIQRIASSVDGVINIFGFNSYVYGRHYRCEFRVFQSYSTETLLIEFNSEDL